VYTFLKAKGRLPDGRAFQSIQWVNENSESANPYDIEIEVANEKIYIEIKSTTSAHKELVAISWRELKFAEEQSGNFHLYRVYRAGKVTTELCWLENLFNYLQNNPVRFLHKNIKELLWGKFSQICCFPYIANTRSHRSAGAILINCQNFNKMYSISGYVWSMISNLGHTYYINVTSQ